MSNLPTSKKASLEALVHAVMAGERGIYTPVHACTYDATWSRGVFTDAQNAISPAAWLTRMRQLPSIGWIPVPDTWVLARLVERKLLKKKKGTEAYACRSCSKEFSADADACAIVNNLLQCNTCNTCMQLPHTVLQALFVRTLNWREKVILEFEDQVFLPTGMVPILDSRAYSCAKIGPTTYLPLLLGKHFGIVLPKEPRSCLDCHLRNLQLTTRTRHEEVFQLKKMHKKLHIMFTPPQLLNVMLLDDADYVCAGCNVQGTSVQPLKLCSRCKATFYCNSACSKQHWKVHKRVCISQASSSS